ncbi:DNA repair helicase XPB [Spirochaeta thermophila]|nr:DNA repair helicase XPB [Spirochaeta thermophila]
MSGPLIVQSDGTILLEVSHPEADEARNAITPFTELLTSPEYIHTYRITPISLWNAASAGLTYDQITTRLSRYARYPVPPTLLDTIRHTLKRAGTLTLLPTPSPHTLLLSIRPPASRQELLSYRQLARLLEPSTPDLPPRDDALYVPLIHRGTIKQLLIDLGYPVTDLVPLQEGEPLPLSLRTTTRSGRPFALRPYQEAAVKAFTGDDGPGTGYGTIVMPCGAGKTVVGLALMAHYRTSTLILTPNVAAAHQWIDEILDKTTLTEDQIAEYTGESKDIKPVTVATYHILTWRPDQTQEHYPHFDLFLARNWGLIIYDEVHLLPAPVFRITAELQAKRRCGLTATLVREDGKERHLFALVGPKRHDIPWKEVEAQGWIAEALCYEIRIPLPEDLRLAYIAADQRKKHTIASTNPLKDRVVAVLLERHPDLPTLIIGQYLDQLERIARTLGLPLITGRTPNRERERLYREFKEGRITRLVVSRVANFSIDLPDAAVAIQVSGTFGSRQEEAQRLGRILRPKHHHAYFYTIVTRDTLEEHFAANRQRFLTEQGYRYQMELWSEDELT